MEEGYGYPIYAGLELRQVCLTPTKRGKKKNRLSKIESVVNSGHARVRQELPGYHRIIALPDYSTLEGRGQILFFLIAPRNVSLL